MSFVFVKVEMWYSSTFHSGAIDLVQQIKLLLVKFKLVHFHLSFNFNHHLVLVLKIKS